MFAIALAGSAFTRISKASAFDGATMYYQDGYGSCAYWIVIDLLRRYVG
jgi:hypothetical protein